MQVLIKKLKGCGYFTSRSLATHPYLYTTNVCPSLEPQEKLKCPKLSKIVGRFLSCGFEGIGFFEVGFPSSFLKKNVKAGNEPTFEKIEWKAQSASGF